MVTAAQHDWTLVAPWYRWERIDGQEPDRALHADRPALHKYATTDFVDDFLEDPRVSVGFEPDRDYTTNPTPQSAGVAKLFQPAHSRFYLVAIELHCLRPGFPSVDPSRVAEAGFVIRRASDTASENDEASRELARDRVRTVTDRRASSGLRVMRRLHPFRSIDANRVASRAHAARSASALRGTAQRQGAIDTTTSTGETGWVGTGDGTIGAWLPLPTEPDAIVETSYPMQALRPDPDDPEHAALDGTIFFGFVPTGSDEVTISGKNRFDPREEYVIRCFVRMDEGDCPGRLVWSRETHPLRLASFFDPVGSAQRPVEIAMPDVPALKTAAALPSVRMSAPDESSFRIKSGSEVPTGNGEVGGAQVCFHSIPLITIVATFVLNIFMPIVVWLFKLWWMLGLKFCFPSGIDDATDPALPVANFLRDNNIDDLEDAVADIGSLLTADKQTELHDLLDTYLKSFHTEAVPLGTDFGLGDLLKIFADKQCGRIDGGWPQFAGALTYTSAIARHQVNEPWPL